MNTETIINEINHVYSKLDKQKNSVTINAVIQLSATKYEKIYIGKNEYIDFINMNYVLTSSNNKINFVDLSIVVLSQILETLTWLIDINDIRNLSPMKYWVVSKKTFDIMGETKTNTYFNDGYFVIEAINLVEAKIERDRMEASTFNTKSIEIEKLLGIINDIERGHGSSYISPELLKDSIKSYCNK